MLPALIAAGASLAGGFMNSKANKQAAKATERNAVRNIELQKEFAQSGIQWKADDARKAGIHPLYAMGASTASFTPQTIGAVPDTSMGTAVASAGQDISSSINRTRTPSQRITAYTETAQKLTLQKMGLENQMLGAQLAKINASQNPPMPTGGNDWLVPGQSGSGQATLKVPLPQTGYNPSAPHTEGGAVADVGYARTKTGYVPIPSTDVKERIEDNTIQEILWAIRNNLAPMLLPSAESPPNAPTEKGKDWRFHPFKMEYRQMKRDPIFGFNY